MIVDLIFRARGPPKKVFFSSMVVLAWKSVFRIGNLLVPKMGVIVRSPYCPITFFHSLQPIFVCKLQSLIAVSNSKANHFIRKTMLICGFYEVRSGFASFSFSFLPLRPMGSLPLLSPFGGGKRGKRERCCEWRGRRLGTASNGGSRCGRRFGAEGRRERVCRPETRRKKRKKHTRYCF